jgi:hypothetical protein
LGLDDAPTAVRDRCQQLVGEVIACGGPHGRAVRLALAILLDKEGGTSGNEVAVRTAISIWPQIPATTSC